MESCLWRCYVSHKFVLKKKQKARQIRRNKDCALVQNTVWPAVQLLLSASFIIHVSDASRTSNKSILALFHIPRLSLHSVSPGEFTLHIYFILFYLFLLISVACCIRAGPLWSGLLLHGGSSLKRTAGPKSWYKQGFLFAVRSGVQSARTSGGRLGAQFTHPWASVQVFGEGDATSRASFLSPFLEFALLIYVSLAAFRKLWNGAFRYPLFLIWMNNKDCTN